MSELMDAVQLGPLVISAPRFYAGLGLLVLIAVAEVLARTARRDGAGFDPGWAWTAAAAVFIGARLGFVSGNASYYLSDPLGVFKVWQGGFSPWWGAAAGAVVVAVAVARDKVNLRQAALPVAAALSVWLAVPYVTDRLDDRVIALPNEVFQRLEGGTFEFAGRSGKPVVLNLWATWCGPCQRELPHLARAAQDWPEIDIIYLNQGESADVIRAYLLDHEEVVLEDVLLDPRQRTGIAMGSFGLPTTYFFAGNGEHFSTQVGELSGPALTREIGRLVSAAEP